MRAKRKTAPNNNRALSPSDVASFLKKVSKFHRSGINLDDAQGLVVLLAGTEGLLRLEVEHDVLAAKLRPTVEVVEVAVVGGVVKHRGGLGARAGSQLALLLAILSKRNVELVNVVGCLSGRALSGDLRRRRSLHSVVATVVRVRPAAVTVHPRDDLCAHIRTGVVQRHLNLALCVDATVRSGAVVVSRRHHGDRGHQGKGGGVHFVGRKWRGRVAVVGWDVMVLYGN